MKEKSEIAMTRRSHQNTGGNSQMTSHGSFLHNSHSRSGIFGTSSKRNVAFDAKIDKVPTKKAVVQVNNHIAFQRLLI